MTSSSLRSTGEAAAVDAFVTLLEDDCADDDDAGWAKRSRFTIDEALDILDLPCSGRRGARGQESPDSAPSIAGFPPGSPLFPLENLESEGEQEAPSAQLHSAPPTPPAGPLPACGVLLRDLPEIIKRAADRKSIPLPPEPPSPVPNDMVGDIYRGEQETSRLALWPRFPALRPFRQEEVGSHMAEPTRRAPPETGATMTGCGKRAPVRGNCRKQRLF
ncbi:hypothetical protein Q5P01_019088 [Channa striata]|uniref:Uncharacterized protein n=1 Tax=Channa striata TaxID=64152 RepID=A0AA88M0M9_CHASR|nr:hypothetical protein Q5P01_019088 [Channa striata]